MTLEILSDPVLPPARGVFGLDAVPYKEKYYMVHLTTLIRDIPDFPKKGIVFKDITPLLSDGGAFKEVIDHFAERLSGKGVHKVVGIEARGFAFAAPLAYALGTGVTMVRKPGKLPFRTVSRSYDLEYGSDTLEAHEDAIVKGEKVVLIDDLLATGGTMNATRKLIEHLGGEIVEIQFLIELSFLKGRKQLEPYPVYSLLQFASEG